MTISIPAFLYQQDKNRRNRNIWTCCWNLDMVMNSAVNKRDQIDNLYSAKPAISISFPAYYNISEFLYEIVSVKWHHNLIISIKHWLCFKKPNSQENKGNEISWLWNAEWAMPIMIITFIKTMKILRLFAKMMTNLKSNVRKAMKTGKFPQFESSQYILILFLYVPYSLILFLTKQEF